MQDDLLWEIEETKRIAAEEIRVSGRSSSGVRLINLHEDDLITSVSSVSKILDDKEEEFSETDD
jgi:DNA gyrase/topoisomerase IV subunit A